MEALINITNQASSYLQKEDNNLKENKQKNELINLLKQKIEESIIEDRRIIINVSTPLMICRNAITVEDYEINEKYLYLNHENFELHIDLDEIEIKYNDIVNTYGLIYNDMNIVLYLT